MAPGGGETAAAGPMSRMRPFSITMVVLGEGAAPLPSISVAPVSAVTGAVPCAAALVENATAAVDNDTAAARAGRELARMMAFRCWKGEPRRHAVRGAGRS